MHLDRLWATLAIDSCVARGVDHFFLAPGSRCTPLTLAAAQNPRAVKVRHFDERGLAFAALGYARATGKPGVFICTSGTAVANAFPAVVEANMDHVPMLLLTADRPPELRDAGANQTIDQQKIFGDYAAWFRDIPCPNSDVPPEFVRSQLDYAIQRTARGPVHLNWMFREPFGVADTPVELADVNDGFRVVRQPAPTSTDDMRHAAPEDIPVEGGDTLIIVGGCRGAEAAAARNLADRLQAPIVGDVTSGLRNIPLDLTLSGPVPAPDTLIHVGDRIVSKRWWDYLRGQPPRESLHLTTTGQRINPTHLPTRQIHRPIVEACQAVSLGRASSHAFLTGWQRAGRHCRDQTAAVLGGRRDITEPTVAFVLPNLLPSESGLFLGNSMPVRDMDRYGFWDWRRNITVAANRGASGIDGVIASAAGFACGLQRPVTLLLGDLSALHDLNSLALARSLSLPLVILIVNNHGGGIFDHLPVARQTTHFEQYFATPHEFDFTAAADMFQLTYEKPANLTEFERSYASAGDRASATVIELTTERARNQALRNEIEQRIRRSAG